LSSRIETRRERAVAVAERGSAEGDGDVFGEGAAGRPVIGRAAGRPVIGRAAGRPVIGRAAGRLLIGRSAAGRLLIGRSAAGRPLIARRPVGRSLLSKRSTACVTSTGKRSLCGPGGAPGSPRSIGWLCELRSLDGGREGIVFVDGGGSLGAAAVAVTSRAASAASLTRGGLLSMARV
jgi:hypothetical protein